MRRLLPIVIVLLAASPTVAQRQTLPSGATLPANCNVGDLYVLNIAPIGLHHCIAVNTWQVIRITTPLGVLDGGLALTASVEDAVPIGDGIAAYITSLLPSCSGGSNALTYNNTTDVFGCNTIAGGSGDAVSVNGVAATDADFDDATPAAPAGAVNVKWQKDTLTPNNVSAFVDVNAVSNTVLRDSGALSVIGRSANSTGDPADIAATAASGAVLRESGSTIGFGTVATAGITDNAVTYAKIQDVSATSRLLGRITAGAGDTEELTGTQATTLLDIFTSTLKGVAPLSGGGTTNFLRADGTWAAPAGGTGASLTRINASSGAAGTDITWQKLSANCAANATTTLATCMTTTGVGAGTWRFRYTIIYQAAATTTGVKFAINHTGTTGAFATTWWHNTTGSTATTAIGDQVSNGQLIGILEGKSERVKNTATFASVGVDTANSDILAVLEGIVVVTASGSLEFRHASEVAASSQVMANTTLELHKIG